MPQPKSSSSSKAAPKQGAAKARATPKARSKATPRKTATTADAPSRRPPAAKGSSAKPAAGRASRKPAKPAARRRSSQSAAAERSQDQVQAGLAAMRERLTRGVVVTADAIQESLDDAVSRGRVTRADAQDMSADLVTRGRRQAEEFLAEVERLLGRGRAEVESATADTRQRLDRAGDRVVREVDRARRVAGIGSNFPILGYDSLTAAQVTSRVRDLAPPELRAVRAYEQRNAKRKSVLKAVEQRLK